MKTGKEKAEMRAVQCDLESENGIYPAGYYYVMTPTFHFHGRLEAVTAMGFVLSDVSVVFESGPYEDFFNGKPKDMQRLTNSSRSIIDRAGCAMHYIGPERLS